MGMTSWAEALQKFDWENKDINIPILTLLHNINLFFKSIFC